jgi:hypothetical protein
MKRARGNTPVPSRASVEHEDDGLAGAERKAADLADAEHAVHAGHLARTVSEATGWKVVSVPMGMTATRAGCAPVTFFCSSAAEAADKMTAHLTSTDFVALPAGAQQPATAGESQQ